MRYTAGDVLRQPSRLAAWWYEWPLQRHVRRAAWWRWLLFEQGQGWLRWGGDVRYSHSDRYYEPPEPYTVFPPLRRLCDAVRYRAMWPFGFRDEDRRLHRAW